MILAVLAGGRECLLTAVVLTAVASLDTALLPSLLGYLEVLHGLLQRGRHSGYQSLSLSLY